MADVSGIECAQLIKIVEFENRPGGVFLEINGGKRSKIVFDQTFPKLVVIGADG